MDLIKAIKNNYKYKIIGVRPGEKIHEELISKADSLNTYDLNYCYSIIDSMHTNTIKYYLSKKFKKIKKEFSIIVLIIQNF